jgi:hypothetical protein
MATLPTFFRKSDGGPQGPAAPGPEPVRAHRDRFQLRALPLEDVFFYSKYIDNSRLVREQDPQSGGRCWSAIGAACVALVLLTGVLAPKAAGTLAGYRLQGLRAQERRLLDQRRALELQEAELLSPQNLDQFAKQRDLALPGPGQVVHLEPKGEGSFAMVKP